MCKPHGLSKRSEPYYRTPKSSLDKMKKIASVSTAKSASSKLLKEQGGEIESVRPTTLPRNRQQISNLRRQVTDSDVLYTILLECKLAQGTVDSFIRDVKAAPNPQSVMFFDWQINEMSKFLTNNTKFGVLNVDTTFNLGKFYVTTTSYPHLLLENIRTGKHPDIIGPVLVHQKLNFSSFNYFANTLVSHERNLKNIMVFGTDGDSGLIEALGHNFPKAIQLRCFIHLRKNIQEKLRDFGIPSDISTEFLADIFGRQISNTKEEGLVDCASEEEFDARVTTMEQKWNSREKPFQTESGPRFYTYFSQYVAAVVKYSMCRYVREAAGLGCPPHIFTTNSVESVNSLIKKKVDFKESEWPSFNSQLRELINDQRQEVIRALSSRGEYRLAPPFRHLCVGLHEWTKMRPEQRKTVIHAFDNTKINHITSCNTDVTYLDASMEPMTSNSSSLSISADDSGITTIPIVLLQSMWKKADKLFADPKAITIAPGNNEKSRMVLSYTSEIPHLVQHKGGGRFVCDSNCLQWKSSFICSHTLACAQKVGDLQEFLSWFISSRSVPNITTVAMDGLSSGRGKKGGRPKRQRGKKMPDIETTCVRTALISTSTTTATTVSSSMPCSSNYLQTVVGNNILGSTNSVYLPYSPLLYSSPCTTYAPDLYAPQCTPYSTPFASPFTSSYSQAHVSHSTNPNTFYLKFIQGNIRMCQGCRNSLRSVDGKVPPPPFDLTIARAEKRQFRDSSGCLVTPKRETVCHYHCSLNCIRNVEPSFDPNSLHIPADVNEKLLTLHIHHLQSTFGIL